MVIHQTAIISASAELQEGVDVGPFTVIGKNVKVGKNTSIGAQCVISDNVEIGENCKVFPQVSIGLEPQDLTYDNEPTKTIIGNNVTLREFCTIHRGTQKGHGYTKIGDNCFLMNYVHVGHDCIIGNHVIIANGTNLGGHVTIHDRANISALFLAHQFVEIGELTMISGHSGARKSIPPYTIAEGRPARIVKINKIGLERAGFSEECVSAIASSYTMLRKKETKIALESIEEMSNTYKELKKIVDFYRNSQKGVVAFYSIERNKS